jgi:hypothetical protein
MQNITMLCPRCLLSEPKLWSSTYLVSYFAPLKELPLSSVQMLSRFPKAAQAVRISRNIFMLRALLSLGQ